MHADAMTTKRETARDRLVTTVCFAVLVHGLVILGVGFTDGVPATVPGQRALEITLVDAPTDDAPEQADYLADAAQRGGGNIDERLRARSPDAAIGDPSAAAAHARGRR